MTDCLWCLANLKGRGRRDDDTLVMFGELVYAVTAVFTNVRGCVDFLNNVKTVPSGQVAQCLDFNFLSFVVESGLDNNQYYLSLMRVRRILKEKL